MKILTALLLALVPISASAQTGRIFVSVEAYIGLARVVHVGKIIELKQIEYEKPLTETQQRGKPYRLVFEVNETIRGDEIKRLELVLSLQSTHFLEYMREQSVEIMLVGGPNRIDSYPRPRVGIEEQGKQLNDQWYQFRMLTPVKDPESADEKEITDQLNSIYDNRRMFTNELDVVEGREGVLKRARAFAEKHPKMLSGVLVGVPNEFGAICGSPNAYSLIKLPICPSTKETLVALNDDPGLVLRRFKKSQFEDYYRSQLLTETKKALALFTDEGGE